MRACYLFAAALLPCVSSLAQVTFTATARTSMRASAGRNQQSIGAGKDVLGKSVAASDRRSVCTANAGCSVQRSGTGLVIQTGASVYNQIFFGCMLSSSARADVLVRLRAPQPTRGRLVIVTTEAKGFSSFLVDVGDDGSYEMSRSPFGRPGAGMLEHAVDVGPSGIVVRVDVSSIPSGPPNVRSTSSTDVSVLFVPGPGAVGLFGKSCGPRITGTWARDPAGARLAFCGSNVVVTPHAFLALGVTRQNLVVPPLGCMLYTDILAPIPVTVSPGGGTSRRFQLPAGIRGAFLAQLLVATTVGGTVWRTSEGLRVTLP